MKAEVKLEIDKEDLNHELKELVRELAKDELRGMIKSTASELVKTEIDKILHPLVLTVLTNESFDFSNDYNWYSNKETLDQKLKSMVVSYLNRPSYLYSRSATKPSDRYAASSSGGEKTSLINHIVVDQIKEYVDVNIIPTVKNMIESIVNDKSALENILKEQAKALVLEKLK